MWTRRDAAGRADGGGERAVGVPACGAENLSNSGFVQGREVSVLAQNDIVNTGGTLLAGDSLSLLAGHDIISLTETGREGTEQWTGRLAGIYVQNDGGELSLKALNDIRLTASNVVNADELVKANCG